ncbi:MAG TPA: heat-inducible transcription repressor HrcA [bacterium]|nr:heat-inducible transcription repressor HrcA [bacterium]
MESLTKRQRKVLRCAVQSYIQTAVPVGSHYLVKTFPLDCSPATVRSELSNLEKMGYMHQPHVSSGRIPTDKGYRYYVNHLMRKSTIDEQSDQNIRSRMDSAEGDVKRVVVEASRILGQISEELGVVLSPWLSWAVFDRLELIGLSYGKVLVVIHVKNRMVKTMVLEVESDFNQEDLYRTASVLNERLHDLTLEEIKHSIVRRVEDTQEIYRPLMRRLVESASHLFNFSEPLDIHTCGTQNILLQPEFSDMRLLESMFDLIDDRTELIQLFHRNIQKTQVTIGIENQDDRLVPFTVIKTVYRRGNDRGTLGVIGPTRMEYSRILPLVDHIARTVSEYLS